MTLLAVSTLVQQLMTRRTSVEILFGVETELVSWNLFRLRLFLLLGERIGLHRSKQLEIALGTVAKVQDRTVSRVGDHRFQSTINNLLGLINHRDQRSCIGDHCVTTITEDQSADRFDHVLDRIQRTIHFLLVTAQGGDRIGQADANLGWVFAFSARFCGVFRDSRFALREYSLRFPSDRLGPRVQRWLAAPSQGRVAPAHEFPQSRRGVTLFARQACCD
jgi:hypothetical protein